MAQLEKGHTYSPGDTVDSTDLNALVDSATGMGGFILDQPAATPEASDSILFYDADAASPDRLRRCTITTMSGLLAGVTSATLTTDSTTILDVDNPDPGGPTVSMDVSFKTQTAGKVLAGPVSGAAAAPTFRVLSPADLPVGTVDVLAATVDWSLGNTFMKTLSATTNFIFTNPSHGQTIRFRIRQDNAAPAKTVAWTGAGLVVRWPGGTVPVMTPTLNAFDIFTFHFIGGLYFGTVEQDFQV